MAQKRSGKNDKRSVVNLAQKATGKKTASPKSKKRSGNTRTIIIAILITVILVMLVFLVVGGIKVYQTIVSPRDKVEDIEPVSHVKTPKEQQDKVAYYVLGLLGEEVTDPAETLSVICWDKQNNTVNILQLPQDTYLGESGRWAVKRIADVWGNPKPIDWCSTCRRPALPEEIQDGKHTACNPNTVITKQTGSSSEDLCGVFNDLLGLPVDGYFLFQQQSLVKLVNLLGGIDVNLESPMTVDDITYKKGVQTLDGNAALYYAVKRGRGINADIARLVKERKVFIALFRRLAVLSEERLTNDFIGPLMNGSTPLKTDFLRQNIVKLIGSMSKLEPASMTAYIMPGRTGSKGGKTYYSAHKASLLELLNQSFMPYGDKLTEADLLVSELGSGNAMKTHKQVLSEVAVPQSGAVITTTTTTKAG
ncbi:MAG: LCP family protein [Oscillospiraceae bacterium]|nr:LCP family protein [Oscillospiraceae bacterium]MDD4413262.1 LCP family protein [Oscillospiraceae bacterium]